ncbi:FkbM family methyltransferase [Segetibacter koreensis]|uniref:FkbM family methyltransferase n=1 Tax=Segetibacter koreensis TaxID=398037 RepID=UPI00036A7815|nr:FkbM family methyltransferase [Segetibacter koreensis]
MLLKKIFEFVFGKRNNGNSRTLSIDPLKILRRYVCLKKDIFFLQIGSNDGVSNDPIHVYVKKNKWKGIAVEPVKSNFEKLKKTYKDYPEVVVVNAAVTSQNGKALIYKIDERFLDQLPSWCTQLASFNKIVIESHKNILPGIDKKITEEVVATININDYLREINVSKVDLIHIDTEGYDFEILKLIDIDKLDPDLILYEHKHLAPSTASDANKLLEQYGLSVFIGQYDTIAIKDDFLT